ncbi:cytochrome c [Roseibacterium sp. KMU-115]|uniref:Cytochrome c n=2 Tax=Roseicyclus persicicus TaxID=2650661 RepID=A0A7X6GYH3_9RHOB|nr:cytochrome c [Roseibacterium persicicum]
MAAVSLALTAGAAQAQSAAGAEEYARACATCHGLTGHGDGPLAEYMSVAVPDLTTISAGNNGEFPLLDIIHVIDGRTGVRGHGSMMPVWGDRFEASAASEAGDYGAEVMVRGRILALATFLEAIQQQ